MNTETTPTAAPIRKSPALVNGLLKWPEDDRLALAKLLFGSVTEGFTSLEKVAARDNEMIRQRIEDVVNGKVELLDWRESLDRIEREFRERFPQ